MDANCPICLESMHESNTICCRNNHYIHYACYERLEKKECVYRCGKYQWVRIFVNEDEVEKVMQTVREEKAVSDAEEMMRVALKRHDCAEVRRALELGADVHAEHEREQQDPLNVFLFSCYNNCLSCINTAIDFGADPHSLCAEYGSNAFHMMTHRNSDFDEAVANRLLELEVDMNMRDRHMRTPLRIASKYISNDKDIDEVMWYLEHGADACVIDEDGRSPLMHLCNSDYLIPSELIDTVLDLTRYDLHGGIHGRDEDGWTPLHFACSVGDEERILHLLSRNAEPKSLTIHNNTPLTIYITNIVCFTERHTTIVRKFIDLGM